MNNIIPFDFEGSAVRSAIIEDAPWFVAADICQVLNISKDRDALARLDSDERGLLLVDTPGGKQEVGAINESGLYALILKSRKKAAKRFRKWVTSEVLPSIRKTGGFNTVSTDETRVQELEGMYVDLERKYLETLEKYSTVMEEYKDAKKHALDIEDDYHRIMKGIAASLVTETKLSDDYISNILPVDDMFLPIVRLALEKYGKNEFFERYLGI